MPTPILCNHLLTFRYPATELLPSGRKPYLEVPKDVGYRDRPQTGTFHLTSTNLGNLDQYRTHITPNTTRSSNANMTTPNQLATQLGHMRIRAEEQKVRPTRVLSYRYPAVELLSLGMRPIFDTPHDARNRQFPQQEGCQVQTLGTQFFTTFDNEQEIPASDIVEVLYGERRNLVIAVEKLKSKLGESSLQIVRYDSASPKFRFRLVTIDPDGSSSYQDFELNQEEFDSLQEFDQDEMWIDLLFDLARLESERAVFEFYNTITESHGADFTKSIKDRWMWAWASHRPRTVEQIFHSRFQMTTLKDQIAWYEPGDVKVNARLPCGHRVDVRKIWVDSISGQACFMQKCPTCGYRIMGRKEEYEAELAIGEEFDEIERAREEAKSWQELEALPPLDTVHLFNSAAIAQAIRTALDSFQMAEVVCHPSMCPVEWVETEIIQNAFDETFGDGSTWFPFACSAEDLVGDLTEAASKAVAKEGFTTLTPGLASFVHAWILWTVNLLTHRSCRKRNIEHAGAHLHGHEWWFGGRKDAMLDQDPEAVERFDDHEDRIEQLEGQLKNTTLEAIKSRSAVE